MGLLAVAGWWFHGKGGQTKRQVLDRLAELYPPKRTEIDSTGPIEKEENIRDIPISPGPSTDGIVSP
jgi:hypothetical protein